MCDKKKKRIFCYGLDLTTIGFGDPLLDCFPCVPVIGVYIVLFWLSFSGY